MKPCWIERIKARMEELAVTPEILANQLEITRSAISHYLAGRRTPPIKQFHKMAQVLQTDPAWLQFGASDARTKEVDVDTHYRVPILTSLEAAEFTYLGKDYRRKINNWLPGFFAENENWFAMKIENDAMTDMTGHRKSFYQDDYILVDPKPLSKPGDFVIALLPQAKEVIFRQYVLDGGMKYLKPLNVQYPLVMVDKDVLICGVVVGCWRGVG